MARSQTLWLAHQPKASPGPVIGYNMLPISVATGFKVLVCYLKLRTSRQKHRQVILKDASLNCCSGLLKQNHSPEESAYYLVAVSPLLMIINVYNVHILNQQLSALVTKWPMERFYSVIFIVQCSLWTVKWCWEVTKTVLESLNNVRF